MTIAGRIKAVLFDRLQQATIENGYATDMGLHVHRGRVVFSAQDLDTGPRVSIGPPEDGPEETAVDRTGRKLRHDLRLLVTAQALDSVLGTAGEDHPADVADALLGDIKRALLLAQAEPLTHNGQALTGPLEYVSAAPEMPDPGEKIVRVVVFVLVRYAELYGDPDSI